MIPLRYTFLAALLLPLCLIARPKTVVKIKGKPTEQALYAKSRIEKALKDRPVRAEISIAVSGNADEAAAEGYSIRKRHKAITITGNDPAGTIYGANRLVEMLRNGGLGGVYDTESRPEMLLRGACVGLQKPVYLPGHRVYEYPYTRENFPWFYDKALWSEYLDLLAEANMNTLYLWNGHPFASLVKLDEYPFAPEVSDEQMRDNQEMFTFLTTEARKRGIRIIQMFYNIILSKPFADHYGLKTQDRNRPITPLISDYTRKSIAAFVKKYPDVGFLVCLGEAMSGIETDVKWMNETIIPGILDGLRASDREDLPPIILRSHDTDGPKVLREALPLYKNIYTMTKYTGESLTTYNPGGPWGETQRELSSVAPIHISNVHILANLEPWRWSSPAFVSKAVKAMHEVHGAKGLHLYPQASYWDWPYTADKPLADGKRILQIHRDDLWYKAWGRYAWQQDRGEDLAFWTKEIADKFGTDSLAALYIKEALDESGEIAPKLIRRFGITEGNRQTLLLGERMAQLVNPYKFTIYPGFYESCGPKGEKLIEYVEREMLKEKHEGELPLTIVKECVSHGAKAVEAINKAEGKVTRNQEEFQRLKNDMLCYEAFAQSFRYKVLAAEKALDYKWTKDLKYLHEALPLMQESLNAFARLVSLTKDTYLYANSMQTSQRRIPIGGNDGKYKTWEEMLPVYESELACFKENLSKLERPNASADDLKSLKPLKQADVTLKGLETTTLGKGTKLFYNREEQVDTVALELEGLQAIVFNRDSCRLQGASVEFTAKEDVRMLVAFYVDEDTKFARPPKLEVDATGNEYGQAEPLITNALCSTKMPIANVHAYNFKAGHHVINLPKGIISVLGFTKDDIKPRDAALNGASQEVDWLFQK